MRANRPLLEGLVGFQRLNHSFLTLDATASFSHHWCEFVVCLRRLQVESAWKAANNTRDADGPRAVVSATSSNGSARSEAVQP